MKKSTLFTVLAFSASAMFSAAALNAGSLYKWIDADGNVVYQDTPPPGGVSFEESQVDGPPPELPQDANLQTEEAALANPVSLYTVPVCDSCDLVRLLLEKNSIPFAEKNVRNNVDTQAELKDLSGGLSVPTLIIGDTVLDGFSRRAINSALESAGFPLVSQQQEEETTEQASAEETTIEQPETGSAEISTSDGNEIIPLTNTN